MTNYLKLIFAFILVTGVITLFSNCSSDDDSDGGGNGIVGTWNYIELSTAGCDDPDDNISFTEANNLCVDRVVAEICAEGSVTFNSDGTYSFITTTTTTITGVPPTTSTETDNGTYTVSGDQITTCDTSTPPDCDTVTFSLDNNVITVIETDPDDNCTSTIRARKQ